MCFFLEAEIMTSHLFESLESRQLLSGFVPAVAEVPAIPIPAAIHTRAVAKTFVAKSYFQGTATLDKLSGQLILNIIT